MFCTVFAVYCSFCLCSRYGDETICWIVWFPVKARYFFIPLSVETGCGPQIAPYIRKRDVFPRRKMNWTWNRPFSSSAEAKAEWSSTSTHKTLGLLHGLYPDLNLYLYPTSSSFILLVSFFPFYFFQSLVSLHLLILRFCSSNSFVCFFLAGPFSSVLHSLLHSFCVFSLHLPPFPFLLRHFYSAHFRLAVSFLVYGGDDLWICVERECYFNVV